MYVDMMEINISVSYNSISVSSHQRKLEIFVMCNKDLESGNFQDVYISMGIGMKSAKRSVIKTNPSEVSFIHQKIISRCNRYEIFEIFLNLYSSRSRLVGTTPLELTASCVLWVIMVPPRRVHPTTANAVLVLYR